MQHLRHRIWGHIQKDTQEKSHTNATNVTMHPHRQAFWGNMQKYILGKSQTNAANVTMLAFRQVLWGSILKHIAEKIWRSAPSNAVNLCKQQFESTIKNTNYKKCLFLCNKQWNILRLLLTCLLSHSSWSDTALMVETVVRKSVPTVFWLDNRQGCISVSFLVVVG